MARCRCGAASCTCSLFPGVGVTLTGAGTVDDPWVISGTSLIDLIDFVNSGDILFTATGDGTEANPMVVTADVACINCAQTGNVGDVLKRQANGSYAPGPPNVVAPGAITTGPGIAGNGAPGTPLRVSVCNYNQLKASCAP